MATSPQTQSGLTQTIKPVETFVFEGLQQKFADVFSIPSGWSVATDDVKVVQRLFSGVANVEYPYAIFKLTTYTMATERQSSFVSSRRGIRVAVNHDEKTFYNADILPVDFAVTLKVISNDYSAVQKFANKWMFSARKCSLNFDLTYGHTSFGIKVLSEPSVVFTPREADAGNVTEYVTETTLLIQGFISNPELEQRGVADTVVITAVLPETSPTGETYTTVWTIPSGPTS